MRTGALAVAIVSALLLAPRPARAFDPKTEDAAKKADTEAMDVDFLSLDFKKAKKKLQDAIKKCGKDKCGKPTMALLHRDLGVVMINSKDKKGGGKEFGAAFANDPNVAIGKDYLDNPEVKSAWEAAKKSAGGGGDTGGGETGGGETGGGEEGGGETGADVPTAEGNLVVKVKVAPTGSELPILIEVPKGSDVKKVKVSYKSPAMEKYKVVEAKKSKSRWLIILPCDTTTKPGTIKYFIRAYDADDQEVEHYGTTKKPAQLKVAESVADEDKPLLPGDEEPKSCEEGGGGGGGGGGGDEDKKNEGDGCDEDEECKTGLACVENVESGKKACKATEDSSKPSGPFTKVWIGADLQADFLFISSEHDICKASSWTCSVDSPPDTSTFTGRRTDVGVSDPTQGIVLRDGANTGGKTDGGTSRGTTRVMLSFDYFLTQKISVGGRLGYIFGGNPTDLYKFVPFHVEVRAQYFFVATGSIRPFVLAGAGYGMTEAPVPGVIVTPNDPNDANDTTNGTLHDVTAWKLGGSTFAELGAGMWIMLSDRVAIDVAPKLLFPAPTFVLTGSLELGLKFGF